MVELMKNQSKDNENLKIPNEIICWNGIFLLLKTLKIIPLSFGLVILLILEKPEEELSKTELIW